MKNTLLIWVAPMLLTGMALAQPTAHLAFEVATVKPSPALDLSKLRDGTAHMGTRIDAARVDIGMVSLFRLICVGYKLKPYQVSGPEWLKTTMFDIQAKIPDGVGPDQVPQMIQTLLVERFGLKVHHDSKDQQVYALVVAKGGPKLKESAMGPEASAAVKEDEPKPDAKGQPQSIFMPTAQGDVKLTRSAEGMNIEMPGGEIAGKLHMTVVGGTPPKIHLESPGTTMKTLADLLSVGVVDRPGADMTGLTGTYEVVVNLSAEDAMNVAKASVSFLPQRGGGDGGGGKAPGEGAADPAGASVYGSLKDMGLRLEPRKLPMDLLVVDHVEKTPVGN